MPTASALPSDTGPAWALYIPRVHEAVLNRLRLAPGVEVGATDDTIWVRGLAVDDEVAATLQGLPAEARFTWEPASGRLCRIGSVLPAERMPEIDWRPIRAWCAAVLPPARLPGEAPRRTPLRLVPCSRARSADALLVDLDTWLDWVAAAPAVRLGPLRFAASGDGRALVLGTPLPSLRGRPCVNHDGIVVPSGLAWEPAVPATVIRKITGAPADAVLLWEETGLRVLGAELFVTASRSAARATAEIRGHVLREP